ncbi:MAG: hypothetical protein ACRESC_04175 [Gammaproteobacteria bacterium]
MNLTVTHAGGMLASTSFAAIGSAQADIRASLSARQNLSKKQMGVA